MAAPPLNTTPLESHMAYPLPIHIFIEDVAYPSEPHTVAAYSTPPFYYYSNTDGPGLIPPPLPSQTAGSDSGPGFLDDGNALANR
jgi:hypothetical protein